MANSKKRNFYPNNKLVDVLTAYATSHPHSVVNINKTAAQKFLPENTQTRNLDGWGYVSLTAFLEDVAPDVLNFPARSELVTIEDRPAIIAHIFLEGIALWQGVDETPSMYILNPFVAKRKDRT